MEKQSVSFLGTLARLLAITLMVAMLAAHAGSAAGPVRSIAAACEPEIITLPPLVDGGEASVVAMNQRGRVLGTSGLEPGLSGFSRGASVLWRASGSPVNLGIGGGVAANGDGFLGRPQDINENGVVVAQRWRFREGGPFTGISSWIWRDGNRARLPGTPRRPRAAEVESINDRGVAVGSAIVAPQRAIPVVWRAGELIRLPIPRGTTHGVALDNNNNRLVIGEIRRANTTRAWWWRLGGANGPLRLPRGEQFSRVWVVDERDRIVGLVAGQAMLWPGTRALPRPIIGGVDREGSEFDVAANSRRVLVGSEGGFQGMGDRPWVARYRDPRYTELPLPPPTDPDGWINVFGTAVIRGVNGFALRGGITVGGTATGWEAPSKAVVWTCAQAHLP